MRIHHLIDFAPGGPSVKTGADRNLESLTEGGANTVVGSGATHAWVQIYLPGAGWLEFDPTNALVGGQNLIRIAVTRDPKQAIPLAGSFTGKPGDFLGMDVQVEITVDTSD